MTGHSLKVLLIEDDEDDHFLVSNLLSKISSTTYDLEWVDTYQAALDAIGQDRHDVCLLDYRLGEYSGLDLLRELMRRRYRRPIILLTGQGDYDVDVEAMGLGAVDFLVKDEISEPLLERSIRYAIERKRAEEELRFTLAKLEQSNADLSATLEELQATEEELHQQNEELVYSRRAVEKERERYLDLFENAPDAYLVTDSNGIILEANAAAAVFLGAGLDFTLGKPLALFVAEEDRRDFGTELLDLKQLDGVKDWEVRLKPPHGEIASTSISVATVRPRERREVTLRWLIRDISERKRAEEAQRESEERYRSIFANSLDGILLTIPDTGQILAANPAACRMLGGTEEEICQLGRDAFADYSDSRLESLAEERAGAGKTQGEVTLRRMDGTTFPSEVSSGFFTGKDGLQRSVLLIRDVTERKAVEEKVTTAKAMLQTVFNGISDPLLMIEKDFAVRMLNEASCRYFQVSSSGEVIGMTCHELTQGKCAPCESCAVRSAISDGTSISFERKGLLDPERVEQVTIYPAKETVRGFSGAIIRISDITESKNIEKHLMRADRISSLGQLSGGIAHEIRNPLAGMNLFVDILSDEQKYNRTEQELEILEEIKNNINKIDGIIKRILDFSKQSDATRTNLDVSLLLEDTLKLWRSRIRKDEVELNLSLEENLPNIVGDPIEIQQVLNNLVQNAVEAMKEGGSLSITVQRGAFSFDKKRPAMIIKIQDTGSGVPPDQQKNIFNPFFTTKPTGTGLGLAISHRIVSRHRGMISFESTPDVGTTFTVELPIAPKS